LQGARGQELIAILAQQAPTWVAQMPWLIPGAELEALQHRVIGATQERMLREMGQAIAEITAEQPLILVLEDLHRGDHATTDLLAWLGRRQAMARLLIIGTYRPSDLRVYGHPLQAVVQELKLHRRGEELSLTALTEAAVDKYLTTRFTAVSLP
jgi:predicted ATPase